MKDEVENKPKDSEGAPAATIAVTPENAVLVAVAPTILSRQTANIVTVYSVPGAHAITPNGAGLVSHHQQYDEDTGENTLYAPGNAMAHGDPPGDDTLAVATQVDMDDSSHRDITTASQVDPNASSALRLQTNKIAQTCMLIGIGFVVVLIVFVAVFVGQKDSEALSPSSTISQAPSTNLTQSPTSHDDFVMSLIPEEALTTIKDEPSSPQSKAYRWLMNDSLLTDYSGARIQQRFALATFFYSTQGESWLQMDNWLSYNTHECNWFNQPEYGRKSSISAIDKTFESFLSEFFPPTEPTPKRCNDEGLYQHLWLDLNNLGGSLPDELYMLTLLKSISTANNRMSGTISSKIVRLTKLEGLTLSSLQMLGKIPSQLGLLTNLRVLGLSRANYEESIPSEIWQLTNLQTLYLDLNQNMNWTFPTQIGNLSRLRWLGGMYAGLGGTIPTEFGQLVNLEWFGVDTNKLSGTMPSELGKLTNLLLTSLHSNSLEGNLPTELGQLTSMTYLNLTSNQFSGSIPSEFGLLTSLEYLSLQKNILSGQIPSELGLLNLLYSLKLNENQLVGQIPSEIGQLASLGILSIANNTFSGMVPLELETLQQVLHTLSMEGNPFLSGMVPEGLCILNGTCRVTVRATCIGEIGLSFDCTDQVCGCNCTCKSG